MPNFQTPPLVNSSFAREELPLSVRDAAAYLGVSPQTVYLWVERKQIPHLRVMGRNIRFLKVQHALAKLNRQAVLRVLIRRNRVDRFDSVLIRFSN